SWSSAATWTKRWPSSTLRTPISSRWPSRASRWRPPVFCKMGGGLCGGKAAFGVALVFLGLDQLVLASGPAFPLGPGFYYHPVKLALLLLIYFGWMAACGWIDRDARRLGRGALSATALMILVGAAGLAIVWLMPLFWLGLLLDVALVGGATFLYIAYRDQ